MSSELSLEEACRRLDLKLPSPPKAIGVYRPFLRVGDFAYVSGQLSRDAEGCLITGKIGKELTLEQGREAARWAALQAVSLVKEETGLEGLQQWVKMTG